MTVTYSNEVATCKPWTFIKLLFRWRGSVYKLLYRDLLFYLVIYYFVTIVHLFMLNEEQRTTFELMVKQFQKYSSSVPLSFVLGFFVSNVMTRWWSQYQGLPWPTSTAVYVSSTLHGYDEVGRAMRRTIVRYCVLSATMVFRVLSVRVKKRFPKLNDLIDAGLLNESEYKIIEELDMKFPGTFLQQFFRYNNFCLRVQQKLASNCLGSIDCHTSTQGGKNPR
jgi:bestrophin, other